MSYMYYIFTGATTTITEASQRPSFLSEDVLKSLILDVSNIKFSLISPDKGLLPEESNNFSLISNLLVSCSYPEINATLLI